MKRPVPFRQADVARAVRGALAGGLEINRVEIAKDGSIVLSRVAGDRPAEPAAALDGWLEKHGNARQA